LRSIIGLGDEDRTVASLDSGEALVRSNSAGFAVPIQTPPLHTGKEKKAPPDKLEYSR
jgi:hypothetical protein